jgi:hypothetical protein
MQAFDTLHIYERLKKANASDALAKEMAEIFSETVEERLATKTDPEMANKELKSEIYKAKAETIKWVACLLLAQAGLIAALVKLL